MTVGFKGGPFAVTVEVSKVGDEFDEVIDTNLVAATEVDWDTQVIKLGSVEQSFGGIFDVEELADWLSRSPSGNRVLAGVSGFNTFSDDGGDDVTGLEVEVVSGP